MTRLLGSTELTTWMLDRVCPVTPTIVASINGPLDEGELRAAFERLQKKQPLLQFRIDPRKPRFATTQLPIPLRIVERNSDTQWIEEAEWEANHIVDWQQGPLARLVWLKSSSRQDLLLSMHHVAGDGSACLFFLRTLLEELAGKPGPECTEFPSIEMRLPPKYQRFSGVRQALSFIRKSMPYMALHPIPRLSSCPTISPKRRHSRVFNFSFSVAETRALLDAAEREQTNLHSLICAALLSALHDSLETKKEHPLGCMSAVDLRRLLKPAIGDGFGCFISMIPTYHRFPQDFWSLAREIKHAQWSAFRRGDPLASIPFQKLLFARIPFPSWLRRVIEICVPPSVGISNLGKIDFPERIGPWEIEAIQFVGPTNPLFAGQGFAAGGVLFRDRLHLNLGTSEPILSPEQTEALLVGTMGYFKRALGMNR